MTNARRSSAPLVTGIGTLITIALALPLLAPSCSDFQPGVKAFSKGSFIIPMDVCYQYQTDQINGSYTPSAACPNGTVEAGDVIKAYGLVYQLIRNGVAVYWVIDPAKSSLTGVDLSIQYNAGLPVYKYDWYGSTTVAPNTANHVIKYLGGPFVIDGSDTVKATQVLQKYRSTFRPTATTGVNVHLSNIAFTANVAKMLAGGWNAGGAVPPKLALLNIGSSGAGAKNSEVVIRGYLQQAGLDIAETDPVTGQVLQAGGDANPATGLHGIIYDRLVMDDFIPTVAGNQLTSRLFTNGYQILWVPHWAAPTSCSDCPPGTTCTCNNKYSANVIQQALVNIGTFGAGIAGDANNPGRDIFAECAGLGSFEGVLNNGTYGTAVAGTHFQTVVPSPLVGALSINANTTSTPTYQPGNFASPLMQLGDYPFIPRTGAIQNYKPASASTAYVNVLSATDNTIRLISEANNSTYDVFTHRPGLKNGHGTFVYLGGHSYSGTDGSFEIGGTRLVLNTLFNLGASCTESGVVCDTGLLGACGRGVFKCRADGTTYCAQVNFPKVETCNGIDDNCDGSVDEGLDTSCYGGPAGTAGVGICHAGVSSCVRNADGTYGFSACTGQQLPQPETCNGLDDDCNGQVDDLAGTGNNTLTQSCYDGDASSLDPASGNPRGACKAGVQTCIAGSWGACAVCPVGAPAPSCQILPKPDDCSCAECSGAGAGQDWNCDGVISTCGVCAPTTTRSCYSGPSGTAGVGACKAGTQTCDASGNWGTCVGEVLPQPEICNDLIDQDCNGIVEKFPNNPQCGECVNGTTRDCYTGPAGTLGVGACKAGKQLCSNLAWGPCGSGGVSQTLPSSEVCDGLDNDCNGTADNGAQCGSGFACVNGVCVYDTCGGEILCSEGYACNNSTQKCEAANCGSTGTKCPSGSTCSNGACVDPNAGLNCGPGSSPAGGFCTGGACYEAGCATGQLCLGGGCVTDPCAGLICPGGTFCRQGDCVQACAFVSCGAGQACDQDGFCVADPCAGKTCGPTQSCVNGSCLADPCGGVGCGAGQLCQGGNCVDDPCTGVVCPAGQCQAGQCFAVGNPGGGVPAEPASSGCGCGTGGAGTPLALLALLALAPLARRRRPRPSGSTLALLLALGTLSVAGCKEAATPFDPASCTAGGLQLAVCAGESRCVDVYTDPSHCGSCDKSCSAGQACVDQVCGPATTVAPQVTGVAPGTVNRGALVPVPVTLTGARFTSGATVRASYLGTTSTYATNFIDSGHLTAALDLTSAAASTWQLRVVNPDRVISNQKPLYVTVPTPALTRATPATAEIGATVTVHLDGSGLMVDSICWLGGGTIPDTVLPSTLTASGLDCVADLSAVPPGGYKLWVTNPTGGTPLASNRLDFLTTSSSAPTLTSLAPSAGKVNTITTPINLFGGGFDVTSRIYFVYTISPAATNEVLQATSFVSANQLKVAAIDLTRCPPAFTSPCPATASGISYGLKVKNGAASTATLDYRIDANPPSVTSVAPASGYQGESVVVTASGSSLPPVSVLQFQPPGGAFANASATSSTTTTATGTISLAGSATGTGQVRLAFTATNSYSSSFPFAVLSNTAVLQAIAPTSGQQGTNPATVTFTVANLRPPAAGVKVSFSAVGNTLSTTAVNATTITANLDLRGLDTGTYTLAVINPNGAVPSNGSNFTVTPGPPTLASIACTAIGTGDGLCTDATHAPRTNARIPIVVTGSNFAKPDVNGDGGSTIYVFAKCTPVFTVTGSPPISQLTGCTCNVPGDVNCMAPFPVSPSWSTVTVTSPTRIDALFDTTAGLPNTYSFWVQNPGGSPAPQRSGQLLNAFTITP